MKTNKASRPSSVAALRRVDATPALEKSPATGPTGKFVLRLFVAGATARSRQAVLRVRELCEAELKDNCVMKVIDIYQQPELARENQIVATPTLIIAFPPPLRRFIGNLTNITGLFVELDLSQKVKVAL
ncbi:MAG: circadian clock KaiB family protein [Verrucomicrobiota bacterium]